MKGLKFKFFTIDNPKTKTETNVDGSSTNYEINEFLNSKDVRPVDISAEYNENTGHLLISIGYQEEISIWTQIWDFLKGRGKYQVHFTELAEYSEKAHTMYIKLQLENALNYNEHETISHGIYVANSQACVVLLENKHRNSDN